MNQIATQENRKSILVTTATNYNMEPEAFKQTIMATCMKPDKYGNKASKEEFTAFLMVANEYNLNPLTKEIYAFRGKGGGIVPVVSVDGWSKLINSHQKMDGIEFEDIIEGGAPVAIKCRIYRKDRSKPIEVIEYLSECDQRTDVWKKYPSRMLRHKALIQCARYAFGFSGIYDEDEANRIAGSRNEAAKEDVLMPPAPQINNTSPPPPPAPEIIIEKQEVDYEAKIQGYESRLSACDGDVELLREVKEEMESDQGINSDDIAMLNDQFLHYMQELEAA